MDGMYDANKIPMEILRLRLDPGDSKLKIAE